MAEKITHDQLKLNMSRLSLCNGRLIVDNEVIGDLFVDNVEAHFIHYWLSKHLHTLECRLNQRFMKRMGLKFSLPAHEDDCE